MLLNFQEFLKWEEVGRDSIKVKRIYVDVAEDLIAGILLSQIVYWHLPSKQDGNTKLRVEKGGQLWLAKGREDWWDECRITPRQFDRAINILIDKGIVEKELFKFNGSPMVHVRLIPEVLMQYINSISRKKEQREMDFNESVKSNLTKGENGSSQKCKMDINESVKSLTETTTETTTKTTTSNNAQSLVDAYILTEEEKEFLEVLAEIPGYPFDRNKDLQVYKKQQELYPDMDMVKAIKQWQMYKLDRPLKPNANPRSQISNSFRKYNEWGICKKEQSKIDYLVDLPPDAVY